MIFLQVYVCSVLQYFADISSSLGLIFDLFSSTEDHEDEAEEEDEGSDTLPLIAQASPEHHSTQQSHKNTTIHHPNTTLYQTSHPNQLHQTSLNPAPPKHNFAPPKHH